MNAYIFHKTKFVGPLRMFRAKVDNFIAFGSPGECFDTFQLINHLSIIFKFLI